MTDYRKYISPREKVNGYGQQATGGLPSLPLRRRDSDGDQVSDHRQAPLVAAILSPDEPERAGRDLATGPAAFVHSRSQNRPVVNCLEDRSEERRVGQQRR